MDYIDLQIIIESLGEPNEPIDYDDFICITDEIDSISTDYYIPLAKIVIQLGKFQILEYLLTHYNFNKKEIKILCSEIDLYERMQKELSNNDDYLLIIHEFEKSIKNRPYIKKQ